MKKNITKSLAVAGYGFTMAIALMMTSCQAEPDDSNLYVFKGETITDFVINNDSSFSSFRYIMTQCGYDRILSSYGTYTCFLPTNEAVNKYIDSLYNDTEAVIPHNGMKSNSLEGMGDSLCRDITMFHLLNTKVLTVDMGIGKTLTSMQGRQINTGVNQSYNVLNDGANITMKDYEVVNGVVHVIDKVIPRSNRLVSGELDKMEGFEMFNRLLRITQIDQLLAETEKNQKFESSDLPTVIPGEDGDKSYWICDKPAKIKYTIFAEPDEVFTAHGITSFEQLRDSINKWYQYAANGKNDAQHPGWYDYARNQKVQISTGEDYENPWNTVNMFVRYHILSYGVAKNVVLLDQCVYDKDGWNGDYFDYFETMLPNTLVKLWRVKSFQGKVVNKSYLNRYVTNNTLTDGVETIGSNDMHKLVYEGNEVDVNGMREPLNGYIYPIKDILVYNQQVPNGVLRERMRFDVLSLLPELMSSNYRGMFVDDLKSVSNEDNRSRIRFPVNYFDNVVVYNGNKTRIDMNVIANQGTNSFLLYKGDSFQGKGVYDLAIKLPPVPEGLYELRVAATNFGDRGSMMQFYLGTSSDLRDMRTIDIPIDLRMPTYITEENPRLQDVGYCPVNDEENYPEAFLDRGVESDKVMRTHNYMRDGLSIVKESDGSTAKPRGMNGRYVAYQFRRILLKDNFKQGEYWLRMKTVLPKYDDKKYQLDYIELVPVSVYDNGVYMEDMY